ncbi:MAG: polysaccharide pyruvyl transferase CsaB [Clostridia bacterium]|nr:polysaccharide pyruvyl transferase CsaB [Clostridia bacterium]
MTGRPPAPAGTRSGSARPASSRPARDAAGGPRPPRVALLGYYGFGNAGDEALLRAVIGDLRAACPGIELTVLSANPAATSRHFGVRAVHRMRPAAIGAIRRADALILGGGTLLQDVTSVRSLVYYAGMILLARRLGTRVVLYANGLGPVSSAVGRTLAVRALSAADLVTLRDHDSLETLRSWAGDAIPAEVTADAAFGLEYRPASATGVLARWRLARGSYALYALRPWPGVAARIDDLVILARQVAERHGLRPVFLAMHPRADLALARELAARTGGDALVPDLDPADTAGLLALLGQAGAVVAMRLHALVLAAVAEQPAIAISYDPKVDGVAKELGLPVLGSVKALPHLDMLLRGMEAALRERPRRAQELARLRPALRASARRNAVLAAALLRPEAPAEASVPDASAAGSGREHA